MGSRVPGLYLVLVIAVVIGADISGAAPYLALGTGFIMGFLFTFRSTRTVIREYDFKGLLILYLFLVSITLVSIVVGPSLARHASPVASGVQPYSALFVGSVSNLISNVPATQLVLSVTSVSPAVAPKIAVQAGLAGNVDPVASFANILALLMARRAGLSIRRAILLQFLVGTAAFLPALL